MPPPDVEIKKINIDSPKQESKELWLAEHSGMGSAISPEQAAGLVQSGMWLDYGATHCQPDVFDKALAARKEELENVKIRSFLSTRPRAVVEVDPEGKHFHLFSWHFSTYDRKKHDAGLCNYTPLNLGEVPDYYRRFLDPVDIAILKTCPMDDGGYFNFGPANLWQRAVIQRAKLVIVEINDKIPYVFGKENGVHVSEVDYVIEGDDQPCGELPNPEPTNIDRAVARFIAAEVEDGACLQIGIGGMSNAVCSLLMESGVKELGIHTEMLTDGLGLLYRSGRVTGSRKTLDPGRWSIRLRWARSHFTLRPTAIHIGTATRWTIRTRHTSSCRMTRSCLLTTPRKSICMARWLRNPTAIAT
jgi:acyl-CoA hydrolase